MLRLRGLATGKIGDAAYYDASAASKATVAPPLRVFLRALRASAFKAPHKPSEAHSRPKLHRPIPVRGRDQPEAKQVNRAANQQKAGPKITPGPAKLFVQIVRSTNNRSQASEVKPQHELQNSSARLDRAADIAVRARHLAERTADIRIRAAVSEVGHVENVQRGRAEFEIHALPDLRPLHDAGVEEAIPVLRSEERRVGKE